MWFIWEGGMSLAALTSAIVCLKESSILPERRLEALIKALENSTFIRLTTFQTLLALLCWHG